ncbi:MAG: MBL fold metallo-hydrolase [Porticoccaceae bacterium]
MVVPYLRGVGAGAPDVLIVSHNDLDHAGGVDGFLKHYQPQEILMGEVINSRDNRDNCYLGQR